MADPLTILGGIASISQVISAIIGTAESISVICDSFEDAPVELYRTKQILEIIKCSIIDLKTHFSDQSDDIIIPVELRQVFLKTISLVEQDMSTLRKEIDIGPVHPREISSFRKRLRWAVMQRKTTQKKLERLKESRNMVSLVLQHLNFRLTLLYLGNKSTRHTPGSVPVQETKIPISEIKSLILGVDHWLRNLGIFGSYTFIFGGGRWGRSLKIGLNMPTWLWLKTVLVELRLMNQAPGVSGIRLLPSEIRLQNRVPIESPFMVACRNGDVDLIRQHLTTGVGRVHDRTICTGQTPLLLAIESRSLQSVRLLLESGAEPNIGNDDQVLPIFAAASLRPRFINGKYLQLPPQWESWVDAIRILLDHDASIHEIMHGKMMGTMNVLHPKQPDRILEYLNLLGEAGYGDFSMVDQSGFSALRLAITSPYHALEAIKKLQKQNVDLQKILDDGRTFLHIAAELAPNVEILEYVYSNGCAHYINRQDNYGWTPLHWCVSATTPHAGLGTNPLAKFEFLISKGADLHLKARESPLMQWGFYDYQRFTPLDLAEANEPDLFRDILLEARQQFELNHDEEPDVFYDATETLNDDIV